MAQEKAVMAQDTRRSGDTWASWRDSADRRAKDPHVVTAGDLAGIFGREAAAQHRGDEVHPLRIVLHAARRHLLVGADADVVDADDIGHLLEPVDILVEARGGVPDAGPAAGLRDGPPLIPAD